MSTPVAGWFADPMQRHQARYWSGQEWTAHVSDNGQVAVDPLGQPTAPQYQPQAQFQQQAQYQPPPFQQPQAQGWSSAPMIAPAERGAAASSVGRVTLGAAVVAGVGAIVDWMGRGDFTVSGFDVPVLFLFDYETDSEPGLAVGHLAVLLAVALLIAAFARQPARRTVALVAGIGLFAIGALFLLQLQRAVSSVDETIFDYLQAGPYIVLAASVMALAARGR